MRTMISNGLVALAVISAGAVALPASSHAQVTFELREDGPRVRVDRNRDRFCDPEVENCRGSDRVTRNDAREMRRAERGCTEGRALDKAERMGIRRARIDDSDRRTIDVRGRDRDGERVYVTFGREAGCPVLR